MTPDNYPHPYISHDDVGIRIENGAAIFVWGYTEREILRLTANLRMEDIDAIYDALNTAYRAGFKEGASDAVKAVRQALDL